MIEETRLCKLGSLSVGHSTISAPATLGSSIATPHQLSSSHVPTSASSIGAPPTSSKQDKRQLQCRYCSRRNHIIAKCYKKQRRNTFLCTQQHITIAPMPDTAHAATSDEVQSATGGSASHSTIDAPFFMTMPQLQQLLRGASLRSTTSRHSQAHTRYG